MPPKSKPFDKYAYYLKAVQTPAEDVQFFDLVFKESFPKKKPTLFREDFCGTFALACEWAKLRKENKSIGIDLDPEPLDYGKAHNLTALSPDQQKRVQLVKGDVLSRGLPKADIIAALNFSFYIFKERKQMLSYFRNCYDSLKRPGILLIDCFGGSSTLDVNEDRTDHGDFIYYWEQAKFNPITFHSQFYIHFRLPGEKKREKVFSYDWRLWTLPELQDLLLEAGFAKVHVYWEGTTRKGEGDGIFRRTESGDDAEGWIAYLAAEKP